MEIPSATLTQLTKELLSNRNHLKELEAQCEHIHREITQGVRDNTDNGKVLVEIDKRFYLYSLINESQAVNLIEVKKAD